MLQGPLQLSRQFGQLVSGSPVAAKRGRFLVLILLKATVQADTIRQLLDIQLPTSLVLLNTVKLLFRPCRAQPTLVRVQAPSLLSGLQALEVPPQTPMPRMCGALAVSLT